MRYEQIGVYTYKIKFRNKPIEGKKTYEGHIKVHSTSEAEAVQKALRALKISKFPDVPTSSWEVLSVEKVDDVEPGSSWKNVA